MNPTCVVKVGTVALYRQRRNYDNLLSDDESSFRNRCHRWYICKDGDWDCLMYQTVDYVVHWSWILSFGSRHWDIHKHITSIFSKGFSWNIYLCTVVTVLEHTGRARTLHPCRTWRITPLWFRKCIEQHPHRRDQPSTRINGTSLIVVRTNRHWEKIINIGLSSNTSPWQSYSGKAVEIADEMSEVSNHFPTTLQKLSICSQQMALTMFKLAGCA